MWPQVHLTKANLTAIIGDIAPGEPALVTADDIALIWLKNSSNAEKVSVALSCEICNLDYSAPPDRPNFHHYTIL